MGRYATTAKTIERYCFQTRLNKIIHSSPSKKTSTNGISLIELLTILSLISMMLSFWVIPIYQQWLLDFQLKIQAHRLLNSIQYARNIAIQQHKKVLLCGHKVARERSQQWEEGWVVVGEDPVTRQCSQPLYRYRGLNIHQALTWHGARGVDTLQFTPRGTSSGYNGHFTLCYKLPHHSTLSYVIHVSSTGRARLACSPLK